MRLAGHEGMHGYCHDARHPLVLMRRIPLRAAGDRPIGKRTVAARSQIAMPLPAGRVRQATTSADWPS